MRATRKQSGGQLDVSRDFAGDVDTETQLHGLAAVLGFVSVNATSAAWSPWLQETSSA